MVPIKTGLCDGFRPQLTFLGKKQNLSYLVSVLLFIELYKVLGQSILTRRFIDKNVTE